MGVLSMLTPGGTSMVPGCMQGVIVYFRVVDGQLRAGDVVKLMNTGKEYQVDEVGVLAPKQVPVSTFGTLCTTPHHTISFQPISAGLKAYGHTAWCLCAVQLQGRHPRLTSLLHSWPDLSGVVSCLRSGLDTNLGYWVGY